jgi:hypothetical protein
LRKPVGFDKIIEMFNLQWFGRIKVENFASEIGKTFFNEATF